MLSTKITPKSPSTSTSTSTKTYTVGYDNLETMLYEDSLVHTILTRATPAKDLTSNEGAIPPYFFYSGVLLSQESLQELAAIDGVWVSPGPDLGV